MFWDGVSAIARRFSFFELSSFLNSSSRVHLPHCLLVPLGCLLFPLFRDCVLKRLCALGLIIVVRLLVERRPPSSTSARAEAAQEHSRNGWRRSARSRPRRSRPRDAPVTPRRRRRAASRRSRPEAPPRDWRNRPVSARYALDDARPSPRPSSLEGKPALRRALRLRARTTRRAFRARATEARAARVREARRLKFDPFRFERNLFFKGLSQSITAIIRPPPQTRLICASSVVAGLSLTGFFSLSMQLEPPLPSDRDPDAASIFAEKKPASNRTGSPRRGRGARRVGRRRKRRRAPRRAPRGDRRGEGALSAPRRG